jgi:hypothetical protein
MLVLGSHTKPTALVHGALHLWQNGRNNRRADERVIGKWVIEGSNCAHLPLSDDVKSVTHIAFVKNWFTVAEADLRDHLC